MTASSLAIIWRRTTASLILFTLFAHAGVAGQTRQSSTDEISSAEAAGSGTANGSYIPPMRGAPDTRISGGTRGDSSLSLHVLAPAHTGWTASDQPSLYWYTAMPVSEKAEIAITDEDSLATVLEAPLPTPIDAGIHVIHLREHGVRLQAAAEYRWSVVVVVDESQRSKDVVASGTIKYVAPGEDVRGPLGSLRGMERADGYISRGFWYDGIDAISVLIGREPNRVELREMRAAWLTQVGLRDAAAYDLGVMN